MKKLKAKIVDNPLTSLSGIILIGIGIYRLIQELDVTESLAVIAAGSGLLLSKDG